MGHCGVLRMTWGSSSLGAVIRALPAVLLAVVLVAGCGGGGGKSAPKDQPVRGQRGDEKPSGPPLGFPVLATKNTTRVAGADAVVDAAAVARAVFPARTQESRPQAVTLVDRKGWQGGGSPPPPLRPPRRAPPPL